MDWFQIGKGVCQGCILSSCLFNFYAESVSQSSRVWLFGPYRVQHSRPSCPSPTPRPCSNSCPLSQWCHPTISSSVVPFSSRLQSAPIRVFSNESDLPIRWPKDWSFSSASVLPMNIQDWFPLGLTGLISLQCYFNFEIFCTKKISIHAVGMKSSK